LVVYEDLGSLFAGMPVSDSGMETRVMVAPTSSFKQGKANVVRLRHPRTREPATFLHNPESGHLCELLAFGEEHRCWLIGERLVADGRVFLATPIHPVFLVLPYLCEAERLVPLDQLLEEGELPSTDIVLGSSKGLEVVAERKGAADLNVWKFDKEKALIWLEERVTRVTKVLQRQAIDLTQGAVSSNFRLAGPEQTYDDYRLCALGLVTEYLLPDLAAALQERLGIEEKKASVGQFKRQSVGGQGDGPKPKKAKQEGPTEDYSKKAVKALVKEEDNAKMKALKASAKGTKSIASFFSKKN